MHYFIKILHRSIFSPLNTKWKLGKNETREELFVCSVNHFWRPHSRRTMIKLHIRVINSRMITVSAAKLKYSRALSSFWAFLDSSRDNISALARKKAASWMQIALIIMIAL